MPDRGRGFAKRVTAETLRVFAPLLRAESAPPARGAAEAAEPAQPDPALTAVLALFEGKSIRVRVPSARRVRGANVPPGAVPLPPAVLRFKGFPPGVPIWRKTLVASDVQSQRGNPTGGVRLTQAGFRTPDGERIDQTRYFRETVFGALSWGVGRERPYREDAFAEFRVRIRGQDLGVHRLMVSHKPSGVSNQHNYTSQLHWGELGPQVRAAQLVGVPLVLFPPEREGSPFLLEIG